MFIVSVNSPLQSIPLTIQSRTSTTIKIYIYIEVKYKLSSIENLDPEETFDKDIFDTVLASSNVIRKGVHRQAGENIKRAQMKQQCDYESLNKSSAPNDT